MVIDFYSDCSVEKVGNKASSLIEMKHAGINVPNGIIIDKDTYFEIIKTNNIQKEIDSNLKMLSKSNVAELSVKLIELFDKVNIPETILNDINEKLDDNKKYAVRSSGTKEDLECFSFAGQYKSFLNCSKNDIEKSIISCYKSMFSNELLSYIANNNISTDDFGMAVIVQEMCDAEYSGICFTLNPITGNDKQMLVEIGEGLGENIVSGQNRPEQYYYDWYNNELSSDSENPFVSKENLIKFCEIFLKIQLLYGYPCDIEFAIKENKLYILQARRITKIKYLDYKELWSTADFKDGGVSATICYPYMWSLYEYIWEYTLRKFILDSKILTNKQIPKKLGEMYFARPYWNMSCVKLAMSQVIGYKEREFDSEYGVRITYEGDGETTKVSLKSIVKIARMALAQRKILNERKNTAVSLKSDLLNKYDDYKNRYDKDKITDIKKEWYKLTHDDYLKSESTYFWQIFINTIHQSLYKDGLLKYVDETEYLTLLGCIDNISHLLPFYDMWDISRKIRNDTSAKNYWLNSDVDSITNDYNSLNDSIYLNEIRDLINLYGYHSDKELDVTYECYFEDVTPIIVSVKDMVNLSDEFSPEKDKQNGRKQYEEILEKIKNNVSHRTYNKIVKKITNMREMLWWREEFRDVSTRFYYLIRIYTIKLAKELCAEGIISSISDIWFLKVGNIWDYLDNKLSNSEVNEIIQKNKNYYYSFKNFMSENEIGEVFSDVDITNVKSEQIKGLGANSGIVEGVARVIEDFSQIDRLKENDILVTKFTDTGWTPKFAVLSGIVTEYGGILCHAAIVSREYGIPAIVSCHDAMSKIKDGQKIRIDGASGTVTII